MLSGLFEDHDLDRTMLTSDLKEEQTETEAKASVVAASTISGATTCDDDEWEDVEEVSKDDVKLAKLKVQKYWKQKEQQMRKRKQRWIRQMDHVVKLMQQYYDKSFEGDLTAKENAHLKKLERQWIHKAYKRCANKDVNQKCDRVLNKFRRNILNDEAFEQCVAALKQIKFKDERTMDDKWARKMAGEMRCTEKLYRKGNYAKLQELGYLSKPQADYFNAICAAKGVDCLSDSSESASSTSDMSNCYSDDEGWLHEPDDSPVCDIDWDDIDQTCNLPFYIPQ